jgi:hypothetical protein
VVSETYQKATPVKMLAIVISACISKLMDVWCLQSEIISPGEGLLTAILPCLCLAVTPHQVTDRYRYTRHPAIVSDTFRWGIKYLLKNKPLSLSW